MLVVALIAGYLYLVSMKSTTTKGNTKMTTIGWEADWTIHRDGCRDARDLEIIGTFANLDELTDHLLNTRHPYADDFQAEPHRLRHNLDLMPCTGLR
tara:strand:+ start:152 stop:442 length:291 start_codon:yes stop_codon:yes gene_type:complete